MENKIKIIKQELKLFSKLKLNVVKRGFQFTYPELTKKLYPEYFFI